MMDKVRRSFYVFIDQQTRIEGVTDSFYECGLSAESFSEGHEAFERVFMPMNTLRISSLRLTYCAILWGISEFPGMETSIISGMRSY